jgi:two-component system invasion response regulator UvrY
MSKQENKTIKVALADDHVLLRNALAQLINDFEGCKVVHEANNGKELIAQLQKGNIADVVLLDLNMPEMDGFATTAWLQQYQPSVHILMLTMYDSDLTMIRLLKNGVKGFLKKDIHPSELKFALQSVVQSGYYYSNNATGKLFNLFRKNNEGGTGLDKALLTEQELDFLRLACSDLTYKEIALQMKLNPRSVDTLRDQLFTKLDVKSRVGLAMVALRNGVVTY